MPAMKTVRIVFTAVHIDMTIGCAMVAAVAARMQAATVIQITIVRNVETAGILV